MTASNGGIPSDEVKNYFNSLQSSFPEPVDGKIDTLQFIEASMGVVNLIDQFGSVFAAVKYDMSGNIQKINQVYNADPVRHSNINDLVLLEQAAGGILATDALLWLRRGLHMIQRFFELILEDNYNPAGVSEELSGFLKTAYHDSLVSYHKWHIQLVFSMLFRMCPNRSRLFEVISLGRHQPEAPVYQDMTSFTAALRQTIDFLATFYREHQLESEAKV